MRLPKNPIIDTLQEHGFEVVRFHWGKVPLQPGVEPTSAARAHQFLWTAKVRHSAMTMQEKGIRGPSIEVTFNIWEVRAGVFCVSGFGDHFMPECFGRTPTDAVTTSSLLELRETTLEDVLDALTRPYIVRSARKSLRELA